MRPDDDDDDDNLNDDEHADTDASSAIDVGFDVAEFCGAVGVLSAIILESKLETDTSMVS